MADSPEQGSHGAVRLTVKSGGSPIGSTIGVVSALVTKAVNRISVAELVLLDGDMPEASFPVSDGAEFKPGSEISISAGYESGEETIFEGIVVRHGIRITGDNYARAVIECRDKAVAMTIGRKNANYVDSSDSSVMSTLIGACSGVSASVSSTTTTYKELVQYYCTDWDFLLSRAEANGQVVLVDDGKVTVEEPRTDGSPALTVTYGSDLIEFHADVDARTQLSGVTGTSWDMSAGKALDSSVAAPPSLNAQGNLTASDLASVAGPDAFRLQTAAPVEKTALDAWAKGRQLKAGLAKIQGSVRFQGDASAKIGTLIGLAGVGARFEGSVYVTGVRHDISDGDWTTEAEFGLAPEWFAERRDLTAPSASGLLPGVDGLQIGIVKKLDADPEGQYKVQVSVPVLQAEPEGVWARLSTFYASDGVGAFFVPEIGDEVVLGYVNGDPSHPVILGSLYSTNRSAPSELTAENYLKQFTTKGELRMTFDDENKVITIVTPNENQIVISDDGKSITLEDENSNKVELSASGILLDSPKDITLKATGNISLTATQEISLKATTDVKVAGANISNTADIGFVGKGNATAELSASGQTTVKGGIVMIN